MTQHPQGGCVAPAWLVYMLLSTAVKHILHTDGWPVSMACHVRAVAAHVLKPTVAEICILHNEIDADGERGCKLVIDTA